MEADGRRAANTVADTDPRIAALAEALHIVRNHQHDLGPDGRPRSYREEAATILAALPPDWCARDRGRAAVSAERERIRAGLDFLYAVLAGMGYEDAELVVAAVNHVRAALEAEG